MIEQEEVAVVISPTSCHTLVTDVPVSKMEALDQELLNGIICLDSVGSD